MGMMDELKLLVELVNSLPTMAIWILVGIIIYKCVVIGSIYGVMRLAIQRLYEYLVTKKTREVEYKEIRPMLDGVCVKASVDALIGQLMRLKNARFKTDSCYIHTSDVDWLREAIDEKKAREEQTSTR